MTFNKRLKESDYGLVKVSDLPKAEAWEAVRDTVDYPVNIVNAYYKKDDKFVNANGETNTGREKNFNLVVVDKFRNGNDQAIATVTGGYGTVVTKDVYVDFEKQMGLTEQDYSVEQVYVTGNGGAQSLTLSFNDMMNLDCVPDALVMKVRLDTSVDGTKQHTLSMLVHNKTGDVSSAVYGGDYKLAARHTTTINERTIDFLPSLSIMVKNWNAVIMPMMNLMFDQKFEKKAAVEVLTEIADTAGIGERHQEKIRSLYE